MARRDLLHKSKLDEFIAWALTQGYVWNMPNTNHGYEVARLRPLYPRPCEAPVLIYTRNTGDHYTLNHSAELLVLAWLRRTKGSEGQVP